MIFVDELTEMPLGAYHGADAAQATAVGAKNGHRWSHLSTTEIDFEALHVFAASIGMKRQWFQGDHYDLTPPKRALAVAAGVTELSRRDAAHIVITNRGRRAALRGGSNITSFALGPVPSVVEVTEQPRVVCGPTREKKTRAPRKLKSISGRKVWFAEPFLTWVGNKRELAPTILSIIGDVSTIKTYFEPCVGAGAVFFALRAADYKGPAVLTDTNAELIAAWRCVRDNVNGLIELLSGLENNETKYYEIRALDPTTLDPVERAARMIYISRTGYKGLWRENKKGLCNTPFGHRKQVTICDAENLRLCSAVLQGVVIEVWPLREFADEYEYAPGDLLYFDPPYIPVGPDSFTAYSKMPFGPFGPAEQVHLRDFAMGANAQGARVLVSNSDCAMTRALYGSCSDLHEVSRSGKINSNTADRGAVAELIIDVGAPLAADYIPGGENADT